MQLEQQQHDSSTHTAWVQILVSRMMSSFTTLQNCIYSYDLFFFCIGHWMSLVIGLLTTSWQDLKDRADSFRSMQSEARKRHV